MQFQACAHCEHPNPVGTNYCNDCGATLRLKPCQECGAVAGAGAQECAACRAPFATRPIIDADIAWAPSAGVAGRALRTLSSAPAMSDAHRLATVTRALAETREVIEKASVGACAIDTYSWATQVERDARPFLQGDRGAGRATGSRRTTSIAAASPATSSEARPSVMPRSVPHETAFVRFGPMVFIALLGLIAAAALVRLVTFAGESTFTSSREVPAPYKTLLRSSPQILEAATAGTPGEAVDMRSRLYELPASATLLEQPAEVNRKTTASARVEPATTAAPTASAAPARIADSQRYAQATASVAAPALPTTAALASTQAEAPLQPSTQESNHCRAELRALNLCGEVN